MTTYKIYEDDIYARAYPARLRTRPGSRSWRSGGRTRRRLRTRTRRAAVQVTVYFCTVYNFLFEVYFGLSFNIFG